MNVSRRWVSIALIASGLLALALAASALPATWALITGHGRIGYMYGSALPNWTQWHSVSLAGFPLVVIGLTAGLLLAVGRTFAKLVAVLGLVWAVAATGPFAGVGYWVRWMAAYGDGTPLSIQASGFFVVLVALGVLALWTAVSLRGDR